MTAEQLIALNPSGRCELVEGELRMMSPSGWKHGDIVGRLHAILGHHIVDNGLGMVMGAETGFLLARDPGTVRAPDVTVRTINDTLDGGEIVPGFRCAIAKVFSS